MVQVADPSKRYSMQEILAHPWLQVDLPAGSLAMNDWYLSQPSANPTEACAWHHSSNEPANINFN